MLGPQSAPSAYRDDLRLNPGREMLSPHDNEWIVVAHAMQRLAAVEPAERQEYAQKLAPHLLNPADDVESLVEPTLPAEGRATSEGQAALERLGEALSGFVSSAGADAVFEACIRVTDQMDQAGAYHLSFTTLSHLRSALPDANARYHGWSLTNQARIARQLGDLDVAMEFCQTAEALARLTNNPEIVARSASVLGGLALMRGNHPLAREQYDRALANATRAGVSELAGVAHRGLLIVHASAREFDLAINHGWEAFLRASGDSASQAELLANLASVCTRCGYHAPAFAGYVVAALWTSAARVRLPALGGAAVAAAQLGYESHVKALAQVIERELTATAPYDAALVLLDLARAFQVTNDDAATVYAHRALRLAESNRFFELEYAAGQITASQAAAQASATPPEIVELSESSTRVLGSITSLAAETSAFETLAGITRE